MKSGSDALSMPVTRQLGTSPPTGPFFFSITSFSLAGLPLHLPGISVGHPFLEMGIEGIRLLLTLFDEFVISTKRLRE